MKRCCEKAGIDEAEIDSSVSLEENLELLGITEKDSHHGEPELTWFPDYCAGKLYERCFGISNSISNNILRSKPLKIDVSMYREGPEEHFQIYQEAKATGLLGKRADQAELIIELKQAAHFSLEKYVAARRERHAP